MRRLFTLLMLNVSFIACWAQSLIGRAPSQVAVGEQFRLTYTVNTQDVSGFRCGRVPEGLEVLMGPSTSSQSSFQMVNGRTSSTSSITYTYILVASKNGTFTIPAARINAAGKNVESNEVRISVTGQAQVNTQQQQGHGHMQPHSSGTTISGRDLFIRVSASKRRVHEQEPILLTYKVYTRANLTDLSGKMPDLKNFYTREVPLPQQKHFVVETLDGVGYRTVTWSQYVMYPQKSGKLEIPSITFEGIVAQPNRYVDPFEAFFNGGSGYTEVKKKIVAPSITIDVAPLPARPAGFSGGVGHFEVSASVDKREVTANDPVKLRVTVSGTGNMKLLKQPTVRFPKDFDTYDAKVTDNTKLTTGGLTGSIVYDFLTVPRHQGDFEIPPVEYTYYDLESNTYKTLHTDSFTIHVAKGSGTAMAVSSYSQEDVKELNSDIHYIHTGESHQYAMGHFFFGSTAYWVTLGVLLMSFVSLFVVFRQRAIDNANIVKQRAGKAGKVATKRLRKAHQLMAAGKPGKFYDEVLHALWGFVGDRLNIPVELLSRENISQQLAGHQVSQEVIDRFIGAIDECEFARYAPGDAVGNMNKVYESALTAITQIAETMRKRQAHRPSTAGQSVRMLVVLLTLTAGIQAVPALSAVSADSASATSGIAQRPLPPSSVTKAMADSAYAQEHYQEAVRMYELLLKHGGSADLYYNLGNAYYRQENITRAVLNYERALLLSPGDRDIRFNLQMARSKTIDKITPESEMFFVTWYRSLVNMMSVDAWAWLALVALVIAIALSLVYLFSDPVWLRKVGFFGGVAAVSVFLLANLFAWQQRRVMVNRTGAIVIRSAASVKSTPAKNGTDLFLLHEGTKVTITDHSMKDWRAIRMADGKEGWIEVSQIEVI